MSEQPITFDGLPAVLEYLTEAGWKVSKSTLYNHQRHGKLRPGADGLYTAKAVDAYALANLRKIDGSGASDKLSEQKAREELLLLAARREKAELQTEQLRGELVPRHELEAALVTRAHVFRADLDNLAYSAAPELIAAVDGDKAKSPDLTALLQILFADLLDRYSRGDEITVEMPL